ncbi:helix-turn-helix domain-containing protein [Streptomyces sp. NPDC001674]|uniref:helix-turn-helix domain-containing protein n=1 Tax=Streptomyces sp. NPDC001674 TaxID=3154394 RepID=UPI00332AA06F
MAMVINAGGLDGPEKLLLLAYCNRTDAHGYCWPGQGRLVDDTGTSAATVKRVKARLVRKNLIKSVRRINPMTGESITNLTRVNLPLLQSMKRPPKDYEDNVVQQLTFTADAPAPTKTRRKARGVAELRSAQNEPAPCGNAATASDRPTAQDEPAPGLRLRQEDAQDEPAGVSDVSPAAAQDEPLTVREPPGIRQIPLRPSDGLESAPPQGTEQLHGLTPWRPSEDESSDAVPNSAGVRLLTAIGAHDPSLALHGAALRDQGRRVDVLLQEGWLPEQLVPGLSRPLPYPVLTSVGAVMAARITTFAASPCPARMALELPRATPGSWTGTEYRRQEPTPVPAAYDPSAYGSGVHRECEECGRPVRIAGELCPPCAGYERCSFCTTWAPPGTACPRCAEEPL